MEAMFKVGTLQGENILTFVNNNGADLGTFDKQLVFDTTGKISFYIFTGSAQWATSTSSFATGDVVHVVATYDGTIYRLYINGVQEATLTAGASYAGYTNPVLRAGYARQNPPPTTFGNLVLPTHTLLISGFANRPLDAAEVWQRSTSPWAPIVLPFSTFGIRTPVTSTITGTIPITGALTAVAGALGTIAGTIPVAGSLQAEAGTSSTLAGTVPITGLITVDDATTDTHDGFVRRSRRQRALDAAERRRREAMAQEAVALRLSLEAAMGAAADVAEEAPREAAEAVQAVAKQAARLVPTLAEARADAALLASARETVAALRAAVEEAERARALAEDDEDVLMLLRAL